MINHVILIGHLGADPELKYTKSGTAVTNFRLAVNRPPQRDAPDSEGQVDWLTIVCWEKLAENCAQYLHKGSKCAVEGRVQSRSWETKDGQKRSTVEINARNVQFLDKAGERKESAAAPGPAPGTATNDFGDIPPGEDIFADE